MEKIIQIAGLSIPLNKKDIDTDLIIPAQFLTQVTKQGYGQSLFRRLRDSDPNFVFNKSQFREGNILITGDNFGCGSSREHAVWALMEWGVKAIISTSFSDIFYNNSAKNGLVLIIQPQNIVQHMLAKAESATYKLTIDIEHQTISTLDQEKYPFEMEPFRKYCFTQGHDELDYILSHRKEIENFEINSRKLNYAPRLCL